MGESASPRCYAPRCSSGKDEEPVSLVPEEVAVLELIDLQGLEQEQAATVLGISRKTIWRDIHEVRRKIADARYMAKPLRRKDVFPGRTGSARTGTRMPARRRQVITAPPLPAATIIYLMSL